MNNKGYFTVFLIISMLLVPLIQASSSPPPPPPPCPQKLQGCYDQEELRAAAGSLSSESFGSYIAATACLPGSCDCSLSSFVDDVTILDPDEAQGACGCLGTSSWANTVGANDCCGDDLNDCGVISGERTHAGGAIIDKHLCAMDSNFVGQWVSAEAADGDIVEVGCLDPSVQYIADEEDWMPCESFEIVTVNDHYYMCNDQGDTNEWVECCGSETCNSKTHGQRLTVGQSVNISRAQGADEVYYCLHNGEFSKNLDGSDFDSCEGDASKGFTWTGSLCCSEEDDVNEYYNDKGGTGGCWDGTPVLTGTTVDSISSIANLDGQFYGCDITDPDIRGLTDYHTAEPLINNTGLCFQDPNLFFLCNSDGYWEPTGGVNFSHRTEVPPEVNPDPLELLGCCGPGQCWDGATCIDDQSRDPNAPSVNGLRCIEGEWSTAQIKGNPDEGLVGYCPQESQCLVSPFGNPLENGFPDRNPQCINDGQFIENNYCEDGQWTSRTKFVAQQLLEIAGSSPDYVILCDSARNVFNNIDFEISGTVAESLFTEHANNFCVLKWDDKVVLGTTLKKKLEEDSTLIDRLNAQCTLAYNKNDGLFHACDGSGRDDVWYNSELQAFLYSDTQFDLEGSSSTNFFDIFRDIVNRISGSTTDPFDSTFVDNLKRFTKLYIKKDGSKEVRGTVEEVSLRRLVIEYKDFETDICDFVQQFNQRNSDDGSRIACEARGDTFYVLAEGSEFTQIDPAVIWNDLTSKLRIS